MNSFQRARLKALGVEIRRPEPDKAHPPCDKCGRPANPLVESIVLRQFGRYCSCCLSGCNGC